MSKGRWLQTPAQTSKQPIAVRFKNVPTGSAEAQRIGAILAPRISKFQRSQWQQRELSGLEVYKKTHREPGMSMTYSYINGQETMYIEISGGLAKKIEESIQDFWDFALIEVYVPNSYPGKLNLFVCLAHISAPLQMEITPATASSFPIKGVAANAYTAAATRTDRLINGALPPAARTATPLTSTEKYASFALDLRPLRGNTVSVDLYPAFRKRDAQYPVTAIWTPNSNEWSSMSSRPDLTPPEAHYNISMQDTDAGLDTFGSSAGLEGMVALTFVTTSGGVSAGFPSYPGPTRSKTFPGEGTMSWSLIPETYFDTSDLTYKFVANNSPIYNEFLGEHLDYDGTITPGPMYRHWWTSTGNTSVYIPPYSGPDLVPGQVKVTLFKGKPGTDVTNFMTYYRWSLPAIFPRHPGGSTIASIDIPTTGMSNLKLYDFLGIPKAGSVGIDTWRIRPTRPEIISGAWWQRP